MIFILTLQTLCLVCIQYYLYHFIHWLRLVSKFSVYIDWFSNWSYSILHDTGLHVLLFFFKKKVTSSTSSRRRFQITYNIWHCNMTYKENILVILRLISPGLSEVWTNNNWGVYFAKEITIGCKTTHGNAALFDMLIFARLVIENNLVATSAVCTPLWLFPAVIRQWHFLYTWHVIVIQP
jgi:hypothetical protein